MKQPKRRLRLALALLALSVVGISAFLLWIWHGAGKDAPRIGLSVSDAWYDDLGFHRVAYDVAVARAGGRVVTLKPSQHAESVPELLADLDGILLAGGGDVEPSLYGGSTEQASLVDPQRDRFELKLLEAAQQSGIPVVGICRGIQLMAVAYDGTIRDLRLEESPLLEQHGITLRSMSAHDVDVLAGTNLASILTAGRYRVNSFHAQAVQHPGRLRVCARAPDGVIEGIELPGDRLVLGIQWHPEIMGVLDEAQQSIIEKLVEEARKGVSRQAAKGAK